MSRHLDALLDLVAQAETRALTAEEAARMRTALRGYDQARRQLGAILARSNRRAQRPSASTGSGAAAPGPPGGDAPSRSTVSP